MKDKWEQMISFYLKNGSPSNNTSKLSQNCYQVIFVDLTHHKNYTFLAVELDVKLNGRSASKNTK